MAPRKKEYQMFYIDSDNEVQVCIATNAPDRKMNCVFECNPEVVIPIEKKFLIAEPVEVEKKLVKLATDQKEKAAAFMRYARSWKREFRKCHCPA